MKKVDFNNIELDLSITSSKISETSSFSTAENIDLKSIYVEKDTIDLRHLQFVSGIAPNLRGP